MHDSPHEQASSSIDDEIHAREASASAVGYYFQALYALVVLLRETQEDAEFVRLEKLDDINFEGVKPSLYQVKHSRVPRRPITIASRQLWTTLANWSTLARNKINHHRLILVTSAPLRDGDVLSVLTGAGDRALLLTALESEARRVCEENLKNPKKLVEHAALCRAFLRLEQNERKHLLGRVHLVAERMNLSTIGENIARQLDTIPEKFRSALAKRLLEWWSWRAARSLAPKEPEPITRAEVVLQISTSWAEMQRRELPVDYENADPEDIDALKKAAGVLVRQIQLVKRGDGCITRAVVSRWKARKQREEWVRDGLTDWNEQGVFDTRLIEEWKYQFGPACDDCASGTEEDKVAAGKSVLDWALRQVLNEMRVAGVSWNSSYMTRGVLQQLADERKVGWHPEYLMRLEGEV